MHAVCANGDVLARLRHTLGDRAVDLPIGLDDHTFTAGASSIRYQLGWTARHRVVGYVGRLTLLKGVDLLAEAFRELSNRMPDLRLLIIGKGDEERTLRAVLGNQLASAVVHIESDVEHDTLPERDPARWMCWSCRADTKTSPMPPLRRWAAAFP